MCFNCGCNIPTDNMGEKDTITEDTFAKAAKAMGQSIDEAKRETLKMLKKQLGEK